MKNCYYRMTVMFILVALDGCQSGTDSMNELQDDLAASMATMQVQLAQFNQGHKISEALLPAANAMEEPVKMVFGETEWEIKFHAKKLADRENGYKINLQATITKGEIKNTSLGLNFDIQNWSEDNYVLMPGAVYGGNRFRSVKRERGKKLNEYFECPPRMDPVVYNIPRLNINPGRSTLQMMANDMSVPSLGFRQNELNKGIFILTEQGGNLGDYSYSVVESRKRDSLNIVIRIPAVREDSVFKGAFRPHFPSPDRGYDFKTGETIELECLVYFFEAPEVQSIFDQYMVIRKDVGDDNLRNEISFSESWKIQEEKYNKYNWVEKKGYYSVGMRESPSQNWQTGWTGGMNAVYPLLFNGSDQTRKRALRTFNFLFDKGVGKTGLFYGLYHEGKWFTQPNLLRRNSDALFFIVKEFQLLKTIMPGFEIPELWIKRTRGCADAFVNLWNRYDDFGWFVDFDTGEMTIGGSASNGLAPAALALCYQFFGDEKYLETAIESANYYYEDFIRKGVTTGGPGDAAMAPDHESLFGILESFIVLYEITRDPVWLERSAEAANQAATWVLSYNYRFPEQSTYAEMDMLTTGTLFANAQNKCAVPGICTLSGSSLLRLYRYTGKKMYADLLSDITRSIPQYMSRADRPIGSNRSKDVDPINPMPPGWINERVNVTDWEERGNPNDILRGEVFAGSCWCEAAYMLSYTEIPGIFVNTATGDITVFDNIRAEVVENTATEIILNITNDTKFDATVKILAESQEEMSIIYDDATLLTCPVADLKSGESIRYTIVK